MTNSGPFKLPLISRGSFRTLATQSNAEGASGSSFEPGPWVAPPTTENCRLKTTSERLRSMPVVRRGGHAPAAKFILIIFFVQDVPLLAAFQDFLFLRRASLAHFHFDFLFVSLSVRPNLLPLLP